MNLLWFVLLAVLTAGLVFAALVAMAVRWANQLAELEQCPIETTGRITGKLIREGGAEGGRNHYIRYEYTDRAGRRRSRKMFVSPEAWQRHQESDPIAIVYSERHPGVSAPKFVLKAAE